jgi:hypothetical protein
MNKTKTKVHEDFKDIANSVRFYLPRVERYQEVVGNIASKYGGMSLLEFDGYFEGKFEPFKYIRAEIHLLY